ncbi:MAG TPA: hypothetical protein PLL72_08175, partial [Burkholderiaceae bacterium]|nr:hypothetical protein [Burkholderiaceae bacterium]
MTKDGAHSNTALQHERRVHRMLMLASGFTLLVCSYWGVFFSLRGIWTIASLDAVCIGLSLWTIWLLRHQQLRSATHLMVSMMYVIMSLNAAFMDVPSAEVPRSAHTWLLGFGVLSVVLVREEPRWLRHGVPLLFILTWAVFASTNGGPHTTLAVPEEVRRQGVWVNHAFAAGLIYCALWVIQADVAERRQQATELERALMQGELLLHFQPQVGAGGQV